MDKSKSKFSTQTIFLSINSFFMSFSGSIMMVLPFLPQRNSLLQIINISDFIFTRTLAESLGYLMKLFVGYFSDYFQNRKLFISFGYAPVPIIKFILYLLVKGKHSMLYCKIVYVVCNLLDKLFNTMRDGPRDSLIIDTVEKEHVHANLFFRKCASTLGNTLGIIFFIFVGGYTSLSNLFLMSTIISGISYLITILGLKNKSTTPEAKKEKINIIVDVKKELSSNKSVLLIMAAAFLLFLGKIDDFLIVSLLPKNKFISLLALLTFPCSMFFTGLFACKSKKNNLLYILMLAFMGVNLLFYYFSSGPKIFLTIIGIIAIAVHGAYRGIIDGALTGALAQRIQSNNIIGSILGIMNIVIGLGVLTRSFGKNFSIGFKVMYSIFFSILGFLVFYSKKFVYRSKNDLSKK